jgi:hypothetical protein
MEMSLELVHESDISNEPLLVPAAETANDTPKSTARVSAVIATGRPSNGVAMLAVLVRVKFAPLGITVRLTWSGAITEKEGVVTCACLSSSGNTNEAFPVMATVTECRLRSTSSPKPWESSSEMLPDTLTVRSAGGVRAPLGCYARV